MNKSNHFNPDYFENMRHQIPPVRAVIRESECIGCMKCIHACPIDAIIGAPKLMHTVIADVCIGCELCVTPCPVDCIDLIPAIPRSSLEKKQWIAQSRERFQQHTQRMQHDAHEKKEGLDKKSVAERKKMIENIMARRKK